jgi:uncharacterized protein YbbC (DUF1343 family)
MRTPLILLAWAVASAAAQPVKLFPGADRLLPEFLQLVKGKHVGLVTNHTGLLKDGTHLADVLSRRSDLKLAALYGPEHGIRGSMDDAVRDTVDPATGVPVFSLYGANRKPTAEMLRNVDVLLFDVQDVGARFYTYISTLGLVMEAAAEAKIPVVVLDRPNPIRGTTAEGPVRLDSLRSFVAYGALPITHGMTVGELARLYNDAGMLKGAIRVDLTVIPVAGWRRDLWFDGSDLLWVKPSPNMPTLSSATVYPGTCLFEGTNLSEGRGTPTPFELVGAPWADGDLVAHTLNAAGLSGVRFESATFTPAPLPWNAQPKHAGKTCKGVRVIVTDRNTFAPVLTGLWMLWAFRTAHPDSFAWRAATMDRLAGTPALREMLEKGTPPPEIVATWEAKLQAFMDLRRKVLLYE